MPFEIVRNDIENMQVDAIVSTANPQPVIGKGLEAKIHAKAGPGLLEARKRIGDMRKGTVCVTPGFDLDAQYVIHAVIPVWRGGSRGEESLLRDCYAEALNQARLYGMKSIALPLISDRRHGYPQQLALRVAREEIETFLREHEMQIYLVVSGEDPLALSESLVADVKNYLDGRYVRENTEAECRFSVSRIFEKIREFFAGIRENNRRKKEARWDREHPDNSSGEGAIDENMYASEIDDSLFSNGEEDRTRWKNVYLPIEPTRGGREEKQTSFSMEELKDRLNRTESSFSDSLLELIDKTGQKDSEIYKKANVSRQLFSKIRTNPYYKPSKATAVAFAIALELDLEQTRKLIGKAGYALSDSSKFDIIIEYFISHGRYDIYEINLTLFEFDQVLLGAV